MEAEATYTPSPSTLLKCITNERCLGYNSHLHLATKPPGMSTGLIQTRLTS